MAIASPSDEHAPAGRRAARHEQTKQEILRAAWDLARTHGLAGISMRDLGPQVGMRAQSLYSYVSSKHDLYDQLFHQGAQAFAATMEAIPVPLDDPQARVLAGARAFFTFCTADPVRFQLLFQRPIPDFTPSERSYSVAQRSLEQMRHELAAAGVTGEDALDLWTAVLSGLVAQQVANDPGGDRWASLVDRAVEMLLRETAAPTPKRRRTR